MSIARINTFHAAADRADDLRAFLSEVVADVRSAPGCRSVHLLVRQDDPTELAVVEEWESVEAHQAAASRIPAERLNAVRPLLAAPPSGHYYQHATPAHPRVVELGAQLDSARNELRLAVESVPPESRDWHPGPDRWSVAEILEHLSIVEARIAGLFAKELAAARAAGLGRETSDTPIGGTFDVERLRDRSVRITSTEASRPSGTLDAATAWARLEQARQQTRAALLAADGLALGEVKSPHPRFGTLDLYQWILFLSAHEGRHAAQIREIAAAAPPSGGPAADRP